MVRDWIIKYILYNRFRLHLVQLLKDDLWPNPLQYYLVPDIEFECDNAENSDDLEEEEEQFEDDDGKSTLQAPSSVHL